MESCTWLICAGLLIVIVVSIVLLAKGTEKFQHVGMAATLPDGNYSIINVATSNQFASNIVDTVQCKDFMIGQRQPPQTVGWNLKRVAEGVYKLNKPGDQECLYTSPQNTLRSYYFPGCQSKNLCGLDGPDYKGELDQDSLRTYFMILQHPTGHFYIKSMKNDMYVNMNDNKLYLSSQPTDNSLFSIMPL